MWNVMEYNIGFWGGSGMAYGVFTSQWPTENVAPRKYENSLSLMLILLIIPLLVWKDAFQVTDLLKSNFLENQEPKALFISVLTLAILFVMNIIVRFRLTGKPKFDSKDVMTLFLSAFGTYIIWSYLITGLLMGNFRSEQPLYVLNLGLFVWLMNKSETPFYESQQKDFLPKDKWLLCFSLIIAGIIILSLISSLIYGGIPGGNLRFPIKP